MVGRPKKVWMVRQHPLGLVLTTSFSVVRAPLPTTFARFGQNTRFLAADRHLVTAATAEASTPASHFVCDRLSISRRSRMHTCPRRFRNKPNPGPSASSWLSCFGMSATSPEHVRSRLGGLTCLPRGQPCNIQGRRKCQKTQRARQESVVLQINLSRFGYIIQSGQFERALFNYRWIKPNSKPADVPYNGHPGDHSPVAGQTAAWVSQVSADDSLQRTYIRCRELRMSGRGVPVRPCCRP